MNSTDPAALEAELIARIAEDPASDAARLVLADFYAQRGDPRGELMAMQLATPTAPYKTRLAKLVREQRTRMVGSLVDCLDEKSLRFERGRLFACATQFGNNGQRTAARGNPLWATVEELFTDDAGLVGDPMMRSLRVVRGIGINALAAVCRGTHATTIESLALYVDTLAAGTLDDREAIGRTTVLPKLRRFELVVLATSGVATAERMLWLLGSALGQQLDVFALRAGGRSWRREDTQQLRYDKRSFDDFRREHPRPSRFDFGHGVSCS